MSTKYGNEEELVREINRLTKELAYVKQLRRGDDRQHRPAAYTYMATVGVAQIGWVILAISHSSVGATFALMTPLFALETVGPFIAERRTPTP